MKLKRTLETTLVAGVMAITGCNGGSNKTPQKYKPSETTFVTTAENIRIEPYYGTDPTIMEGIIVKRFSYGDGLSLSNVEESKSYVKGSKEYETLRPFLIVERSK
jgi:hypothetical protein